MSNPTQPGEQEELIVLLREQNKLLRQQIRENTRWGMILLRGIVAGLGTALGATVVLWLFIAALRPLQYIEPIKPAVEKMLERLDRLDKIAQEKMNPKAPAVEDEPARPKQNPLKQNEPYRKPEGQVLDNQ